MLSYSVGYAGGTPTGAEPALIATAPAYPLHTGAAQLVVSSHLHGHKNSTDEPEDFDLFKLWGNLSPWYSVKKGHFGIDSPSRGALLISCSQHSLTVVVCSLQVCIGR